MADARWQTRIGGKSTLRDLARNVRGSVPRLCLAWLACAGSVAQWRNYERDPGPAPDVVRMMTLDAATAWLQSDLDTIVADLDVLERAALAKLLEGADAMPEPRARAALRVARSLLAGHGRDLAGEELAEFQDVDVGRVAAPRFVDRWDSGRVTIDWSQAENLARDLRDADELRLARAMFYLRHWNVHAPALRAALLTWVDASEARRAAWQTLVAIDGVRRQIMGRSEVGHAGRADPGDVVVVEWASMLPWWRPDDHREVARRLSAGASPAEIVAAIAVTRDAGLRPRLLALAKHVAVTEVQVAVLGDGAEPWARKRLRSAMATYVVQRNLEALMTAGPVTAMPQKLSWVAEPDARGWALFVEVARAYQGIAHAFDDLRGYPRSSSGSVELGEVCSALARGERKRFAEDACLRPRSDRLTGSPRSVTYLTDDVAFWIPDTEGVFVAVTTPQGRVRAYAMVRQLHWRESRDGDWQSWP